MLCSDEQFLNALFPIVVTLFGISILFSAEQLSKVREEMDSMPFSSSTSVRNTHAEKRSLGSSLTEAGILMCVSDVQLEKADLPKTSREDGSEMFLRDTH